MEDFVRQLIKTGEHSMTAQERSMNDLLPEESRNSANLFRGDSALRRIAMEKVLIKNYMKHYQKLLDDGEMDEFLPIIKQMHIQEEKDDIEKNTNLMFITISPAEKKFNYLNFIKLLDRFCKLIYVKNYIYVLEQRFSGVPDEKYNSLGDGIHAHILIDKSNHRISHVKRDLNRIFKNVNSNNDFKNIKDRDFEKVKNYMIGLKKDEFKQEKQAQDDIWRNSQNIKRYYGECWEL